RSRSNDRGRQWRLFELSTGQRRRRSERRFDQQARVIESDRARWVPHQSHFWSQRGRLGATVNTPKMQPSKRIRVMRSWSHGVGLALVAAGVMTSLTWSQPSHAQEATQAAAAEHFERGIELYREGSLDAALVEFERAYESVPDYRVL